MSFIWNDIECFAASICAIYVSTFSFWNSSVSVFNSIQASSWSNDITLAFLLYIFIFIHVWIRHSAFNRIDFAIYIMYTCVCMGRIVFFSVQFLCLCLCFSFSFLFIVFSQINPYRILYLSPPVKCQSNIHSPV